MSLATNIQEYVAERALEYAYAREEEINKLKRKVEEIYARITKCIHCGEEFDESSPLLERGECRLCGLYLRCQNCHTWRCSLCKLEACERCLLSVRFNLALVCLTCCNGEICFGCWLDGLERTGAKENPLGTRLLSNGYQVPVCEYCNKSIETKMLDHEFDMMEFFGIIHRNQKKAKAE